MESTAFFNILHEEKFMANISIAKSTCKNAIYASKYVLINSCLEKMMKLMLDCLE